MGSDFQTLWGEVKQTFPNISPFLAKRYVQRAVQDIYNSRLWSFLKEEGVLYSPRQINSGTFNITQFSNTVVANATATTALNNLNNPLLTKRQIRFGGGSQLYNIISVDPSFASNGILTLDRPVIEITNTTSTYLCYRCYYGPPQQGVNGVEVTDFVRYNDIYNPAIAQPFLKINQPRALLDRIDPQRADVGNNPYYMFVYKPASDGTPQYEMWPHPTASQAYLCSYQRRGTIPAVATDTLPLIIPDDLVLAKAMWYGCLWADKNKSRYEQLKGVNWPLIAQQHKKQYSNISSSDPGIMEVIQVQDDEAFPESLVIDDVSYNVEVIGDDDRMTYYSIPH